MKFTKIELSTMCKKRKHVINEIISTEKSYVTDLKTIMDVFYTPIVKKGIEASENMASIFVNVEMIYNLNEKLYQRLVIAQDHQEKCEQKQNEMIKQLVSVIRLSASSGNLQSIGSVGNIASNHTDAAEFRMSAVPIGSSLDSSRRATITSPTEHSASAQSLKNNVTTTNNIFNETASTNSNQKSKNSKNKKDKKKSGGTIKSLKDFKNKITRGKLTNLDIPNGEAPNSSRSTTNGSLTPTGQMKSFGGAFAEMAPFMRLYTDYINNFSQASSILKDRRKKNQQLQIYLNVSFYFMFRILTKSLF